MTTGEERGEQRTERESARIVTPGASERGWSALPSKQKRTKKPRRKPPGLAQIAVFLTALGAVLSGVAALIQALR